MSGTFYDTDFVFTNAASRILAINGSLSAVSSMLIISIILRSSPESRTCAYHIIMFFMSSSDILVSVSMALNTLPMPYDVHEVYPFAGKAYGNIGTCEAQGFLIWMGTFLVLGSNTILNVYYVCTLRYGMTEEKFKRRVLPAMLLVIIAISLTIPISALRMDYFNPSKFRNYCSYSAYPFGCNANRSDSSSEREGESVKCIRGDINFNQNIFRLLVSLLMGGVFFVLVISLMLVVVTIFDAELTIRRSRRSRHTGEVDNGVRSRATGQENEFKRTRAILIQALMYICAFLLTYVWAFILMAALQAYSFEDDRSNIMAFLSVFFEPLQGFFNAIIFIYQKTHTLRQVNAELKFFNAIKQAIMSPSTVPERLVSRIEIVEADVGTTEDQQGDLHINPRELTNEERQQIAQNSGMRRTRIDNNDIDEMQLTSISSGGIGPALSLSHVHSFSIGDFVSTDENQNEFRNDESVREG